MNAQLRPTVWRTCRALANEKRLTLFRRVLEYPNGTVKELALAAGMNLGLASEYLRLLQARGLLCVERKSRCVHYRPEANPLISEAQGVLKALRLVIMDHGLNND